MASYQFFEKHGPYPLKKIIKEINSSNDSDIKDFKIYGFESLANATKNELTFLNSGKYKDISLKTKAAACITSPSLSKFLPEQCIKLNVKNVLLAVNQVSRLFYPNADLDYPDLNLTTSESIKLKYPKVTFGKNVFIGENVEGIINIEKGAVLQQIQQDPS